MHILNVMRRDLVSLFDIKRSTFSEFIVKFPDVVGVVG